MKKTTVRSDTDDIAVPTLEERLVFLEGLVNRQAQTLAQCQSVMGDIDHALGELEARMDSAQAAVTGLLKGTQSSSIKPNE